MTPAAYVLIALGLLGTGGAGGWAIRARAADTAAETAALALDKCQAQETPKSLQAAADILSAASEEDLAALELAGDVVDAVPFDALTAALVEIGDKRTTVAAWSAANCTVLVAAGADSAVCGGNSLSAELRAAGQALAVECPECDCPTPEVPGG